MTKSDLIHSNFAIHLLCMLILLEVSSAIPEVTISQGKLQGKTFTTESGFFYDGYRGIPYAKPPVGDLRFKDPQPADKWEGVRDASSDKNITCPQINKYIDIPYVGTEDCLYLNVYVPQNTTSDSNLAVMFWIHGGSFNSGSGGKVQFGPDYLVSKNVIVVTINYRLGALGFLCLHSADIPGNAGMKDQIMALKWVQENIKQFGGDPKQVTIFGESAGSASVHYLMMTNKTQGLFSKAILESGTSFNEWAFQNDSLRIAFTLGQLLGLETNSKEEIFNYLKTIPEKTLIETSFSPKLNSNNSLPFAPVVELFPQANSFLTEYPKNILMGGKYYSVPTITGFMSNEGAFHASFLKVKDVNNITLSMMAPNFEKFIPKDLKFKLDPEKRKDVAMKIKEFYFKNEENVLEKMYKLWTDFVFVKDIDLSTKTFVQREPNTYYFKFSYSGSLNIMKQYLVLPYKGASHGDEIGYIFNQKYLIKAAPTDLDKKMISQMTEMWTNFAKSGNPTPQLSENIKVIWKPMTATEINCLDINEETSMIQQPFKERMQFWQDLYVI